MSNKMKSTKLSHTFALSPMLIDGFAVAQWIGVDVVRNKINGCTFSSTLGTGRQLYYQQTKY